MRIFAFAIMTLATVLSPTAVSAQSIQIGPGGVRVYEDRPRIYEERPRYYEERRRGPGRCEQLRRECEYGERGYGNCRRYRDLCG